MEDGSALTPIVANQVQLAPSSLPQQQQPPDPSVHYVRSMAKLCDCPIYADKYNLSITGTGANATVTTGASRPQSAINSANSNVALADEARLNSIMLDCLRTKPAHQLVQRIPVHLLQLHRRISPDDKSIDGVGIELSPSIGLDSDTQPSPRVDMTTVSKLAQAVIERQTLINSQRTDEDGRGDSVSDSDKRAEDLFRKFYSPSSALSTSSTSTATGVRPLFLPVLDGIIVPANGGDDLAGTMLKSSCPFGQRSLLIGWSRSMLQYSAPTPPATAPTNVIQSTNYNDGINNNRLGLDHLIAAERIDALLEQNGLTDEQAVEFVSSFVRSFYRYHNQEIINTIINHYLTANNARRYQYWRKQRKLYNRHQFDPNADLVNISVMTTPTADSPMLSEKQSQQLFVLDTLLEAFQDASVNVPVLKTALIHVLRQLDSLGSAFIGQQLEKFAASNYKHQSAADDKYQTAGDKVLPDDKSFLRQFINFVRTLFNDPNWPLELRSFRPTKNQTDDQDDLTTSSNSAIEFVHQPKGTYLYQLDLAEYFEVLRDITKRMTAEQQNYSSLGWAHLRAFLLRTSISIESSDRLRLMMSIGCGLGDQYNDDESPATDFESMLTRWICDRFNAILACFVATGNAFNRDKCREESSLMSETNETSEAGIGDRLTRFEQECLTRLDPSRGSSNATNVGDLHLVKPLSGASSQSAVNSTPPDTLLSLKCDLQINEIAFDYFIEQLIQAADRGGEGRSSTWSAFNVFDQYIATLPITSFNSWRVSKLNDQKNAISLSHGEDTTGNNLDSSLVQQQQSFVSRSAFWANFIPALNCSRTQPISPTSLISIDSADNSSLQNLNLQSNCLTGAKVTPQSVIETYAIEVKQQLIKVLNQNRQQQSMANQNHHSLRMASLNHTATGADIDSTSETHDGLDVSSSSGGYFNTDVNHFGQISSTGVEPGFIQVQDGQKYQLLGSIKAFMRSRQIIFFVFSAALLISVILVTLVYAILNRRKRGGKFSSNDNKNRATRVCVADSDNQMLSAQLNSSITAEDITTSSVTSPSIIRSNKRNSLEVAPVIESNAAIIGQRQPTTDTCDTSGATMNGIAHASVDSGSEALISNRSATMSHQINSNNINQQGFQNW